LKLSSHFRRKRVRIPLVLAALWAIVWFALPFAVPLPEDLLKHPDASPVLLDRHGEPITRLTLPDFTRRQPVALDELPPDFIACTLAAEDKRFFSHGGFDFLAASRATRDLLSRGRVVSGASTITQQLVKISRPPVKRALAVKVSELIGARRLEMTWSKQEILTAYLNRLDYGNLRRGPKEAARFYFQKPLSDLSLAECALLAGLPQAPSRLNPLKRPQSAIARRNVVLGRLAEQSIYEASRISSAISEPLNLRPLIEHEAAPWLAEKVPVELAGSDVRTTLDLKLQHDVESIVREELNALRGSNLHHAAVVVIDNASGEILALVSSGNWNDPRGGQINGALAPRSPGSTLKPFTYLLSFQNGGKFPGSMLADIPTRFRTLEGLNLPENYDRTYRGPVSIRTALACSLNIPAIRELNELGGPEPLHHLLTNLGLTTLGDKPEQHGLGLTIGNAPVRLLELTNAYATLARGGLQLPASLFPHEPILPHRVFGESEAWLIADILSDADARAPSFGRRGPLELPFRCAVKTGTSSDFHDNWCLGFTREFTVGVWAGNFDQTPLKGLSGVAGAGPIFHRTMLATHASTTAKWYDMPESITRIEIDPRTGHRVNPGTAGAHSEFSLATHLPLYASSSDYSNEGLAWLDHSFSEWFQSIHNHRKGDFLIATERPALEALRILAPADGTTCLLDPELPSGGKKLRLATNLPSTAVWSSPTLQLEAGSPEPLAVLVPGTHLLIATDPRNGSTREVTIRVEEL
jgi:penicillin-binding protein 1C